jgi:DNA polymerase V
MGDRNGPEHAQVKDLIKKHGVVVTSSNYELTVGKYFRHHML